MNQGKWAWDLPFQKLETEQTNEILVWSWLEEPHSSCIDWVIKGSHMVVYGRNCSRFPSMFLSRNLFTGWLKIYLYLRFCYLQWPEVAGPQRGTPLLCLLPFVSLTVSKAQSLLFLSSTSQTIRSVETIWGICAVDPSLKMAEVTGAVSLSQAPSPPVSCPPTPVHFRFSILGTKTVYHFWNFTKKIVMSQTPVNSPWFLKAKSLWRL